MLLMQFGPAHGLARPRGIRRCPPRAAGKANERRTAPRAAAGEDATEAAVARGKTTERKTGLEYFDEILDAAQ